MLIVEIFVAVFAVKRTLYFGNRASRCVAVTVLVACTAILTCLIGMRVNVYLGTASVGLCRRTLEKKLVLKAEMMAVLQPEGGGVVLCQLEPAEVEVQPLLLVLPWWEEVGQLSSMWLHRRKEKIAILNQPWWVLAVVKLCSVTFWVPKQHDRMGKKQY